MARSVGFGFARLGDLLLEFRNHAVLQLRHTREVALAARLLQVDAGTIQLILELGGTLDTGLFGFPDLIEIGVFALEVVDLLGSRDVSSRPRRSPS